GTAARRALRAARADRRGNRAVAARRAGRRRRADASDDRRSAPSPTGAPEGSVDGADRPQGRGRVRPQLDVTSGNVPTENWCLTRISRERVSDTNFLEKRV